MNIVDRTVYEKRIIGIDYGRRRIGVACSDPLRLTAQPLATITLKSPSGAVPEVCKLLADYEVELVVVGLPMTISGERGGAMAEEVMRFAEGLRRRGYQVHLEDERYSTLEAAQRLRSVGKRAKQARAKVDVLAAQIILQDYLDASRTQ